VIRGAPRFALGGGGARSLQEGFSLFSYCLFNPVPRNAIRTLRSHERTSDVPYNVNSNSPRFLLGTYRMSGVFRTEFPHRERGEGVIANATRVGA